MVLMSIGALIGYGISLPRLIHQNSNQSMTFLRALFFLLIIFTFAFFFPTIKLNKLTLYLSLILKFLAVILGIFYLFPKINDKFMKKNLAIPQVIQ
jgi:cell division protein FtsW (lipid II flippase)